MKKGVTFDEVFERIYRECPPTKTHPQGKMLVGFAVGGVSLPKNDVQTLKAEAEMISNTMLWKLLFKRAWFSAQVRGVDNSKDFGDVREARGMIAALALFNDELQTLKAFVEPVEKK